VVDSLVMEGWKDMVGGSGTHAGGNQAGLDSVRDVSRGVRPKFVRLPTFDYGEYEMSLVTGLLRSQGELCSS
jgi:hypothetical protein